MTIWITARTAGLVALVLLTASTSLGALTGMGSRRPVPRYVTQYVHRVTATLGLGALVVHILTILADPYARVGVTGAIVPFTAGYRATWVGLGTITTYLVIAIAAVGFARGRMASSRTGATVWRAIHASAYAAWALALVHGFTSGTDSTLGWVRLTYLACLLAVPACAAARLSLPKPLRSGAAVTA